ncbi:MAG: tetratricopeptide repeat protein, partial [Sediminibacterium sp.]
MSEQVNTPEINEALAKAEGVWKNLQKPILAVLVVALVIGGGYYGYKEYIQKPKEEKAADALFKAQQYFAIDSLNLVLNGDGQNKGALYVIKNYGGTKAANLAHYYAGVSYLKLGDFNNAVKYLKDFSTDAKQVQLLALGCLGD